MSLFYGDMAVAVLTRIVSLALGAAGFLVVVVVVVEVVIAGCGTTGTVVIVLLGGAASAFGADALEAVIMAFTAAMFAFKFDASSCHFFFWARFPCPGPGMLVETR